MPAFPVALLCRARADHEDLADAREVEVLVEGGGGPNRPLLDASVRDGGWFLEVWLGFRLGGEEQGNIAPQGRLIVLDGQEVVGVAFEEVGRKLALGQQRIGGEGLARRRPRSGREAE